MQQPAPLHGSIPHSNLLHLGQPVTGPSKAGSPLHRRQLHLLKDRALLQTNPGKYKSIATGFRITYSEGGLKGLVRGWAPTLAGYSIQGAGKFGLYEYFKQ